MSQEYNVNLSPDCIRTAHYLTFARHTNVCNGHSFDVPRGTLDVAFPVIFIVVLCVVSFLTYRSLQS